MILNQQKYNLITALLVIYLLSKSYYLIFGYIWRNPILRIDHIPIQILYIKELIPILIIFICLVFNKIDFDQYIQKYKYIIYFLCVITFISLYKEIFILKENSLYNHFFYHWRNFLIPIIMFILLLEEIGKKRVFNIILFFYFILILCAVFNIFLNDFYDFELKEFLYLDNVPTRKFDGRIYSITSSPLSLSLMLTISALYLYGKLKSSLKNYEKIFISIFIAFIFYLNLHTLTLIPVLVTIIFSLFFIFFNIQNIYFLLNLILSFIIVIIFQSHTLQYELFTDKFYNFIRFFQNFHLIGITNIIELERTNLVGTIHEKYQHFSLLIGQDQISPSQDLISPSKDHMVIERINGIIFKIFFGLKRPYESYDLGFVNIMINYGVLTFIFIIALLVKIFFDKIKNLKESKNKFEEIHNILSFVVIFILISFTNLLIFNPANIIAFFYIYLIYTKSMND